MHCVLKGADYGKRVLPWLSVFPNIDCEDGFCNSMVTEALDTVLFLAISIILNAVLDWWEKKQQRSMLCILSIFRRQKTGHTYETYVQRWHKKEHYLWTVFKIFAIPVMMNRFFYHALWADPFLKSGVSD